MNQSSYTIQDTKPLRVKAERGFFADTVTIDWLRRQLVQQLPNQPLRLNGKHTRVASYLCFYPVSLVHLMIPHVRYYEIHRQPFLRSRKEVSHPATLSFDWTPATRSIICIVSRSVSKFGVTFRLHLRICSVQRERRSWISRVCSNAPIVGGVDFSISMIAMLVDCLSIEHPPLPRQSREIGDFSGRKGLITRQY
jgi:hypothetical protein